MQECAVKKSSALWLEKVDLNALILLLVFYRSVMKTYPLCEFS